MKKHLAKHTFDLTSGCLCLDFVNTLDHRLSSQPLEKLGGFAELVVFGEQAGALSVPEARRLRRGERESKREASALSQRALTVRELLYRIFSAAAACREVSEADVETLNTAVRKSNARSFVTPGARKGAWQWLEKSSDADRLIGKIVRSAVEVLTSGDIQRVRRCAADNCGWLFIDGSRSRNRRWCEMRTCGSQHKARTYYQRKKGASLAHKRPKVSR
jgi:predicted RNA-binding Zn ribbon-like protein